jgi:hypothetical protein
VLDELINEKLKLREAKKFGLEISASEVDTAYASMAGRMRFTADQLTQQLARSGVNVSTLKGRIKADIAWAQIVRGRYQASLQIGEKDILSAMDTKSDDTVGYDYTMRPILFLVPAGSRKHSSMGASAKRKPCVAAFRAARKASPSPAHSRTSPCASRSFAARPTFLRSCARFSRASRSAA